MLIPPRSTGRVIGRSGSTVGRLRIESGCQITISNSTVAGGREVKIEGPSAHVKAAVSSIHSLVQESEATLAKQSNPFVALSPDGRALQVYSMQFNLSPKQAGAIIGPKGETITRLRRYQRASISVGGEGRSEANERVLYVQGTAADVAAAIEQLLDVLSAQASRGGGASATPGGSGGRSSRASAGSSGSHEAIGAVQLIRSTSGPAIGSVVGSGPSAQHMAVPASGSLMTIQVGVPSELIGRLIGKRGMTINTIRQQSRCAITVADVDISGGCRLIALTGTPESVKAAQALIVDTIVQIRQNTPSAGMAGRAVGMGAATPPSAPMVPGSGSAMSMGAMGMGGMGMGMGMGIAGGSPLLGPSMLHGGGGMMQPMPPQGTPTGFGPAGMAPPAAQAAAQQHARGMFGPPGQGLAPGLLGYQGTSAPGSHLIARRRSSASGAAQSSGSARDPSPNVGSSRAGAGRTVGKADAGDDVPSQDAGGASRGGASGDRSGEPEVPDGHGAAQNGTAQGHMSPENPRLPGDAGPYGESGADSREQAGSRPHGVPSTAPSAGGGASATATARRGPHSRTASGPPLGTQSEGRAWSRAGNNGGGGSAAGAYSSLDPTSPGGTRRRQRVSVGVGGLAGQVVTGAAGAGSSSSPSLPPASPREQSGGPQGWRTPAAASSSPSHGTNQGTSGSASSSSSSSGWRAAMAGSGGQGGRGARGPMRQVPLPAGHGSGGGGPAAAASSSQSSPAAAYVRYRAAAYSTVARADADVPVAVTTTSATSAASIRAASAGVPQQVQGPASDPIAPGPEGQGTSQGTVRTAWQGVAAQAGRQAGSQPRRHSPRDGGSKRS